MSGSQKMLQVMMILVLLAAPCGAAQPAKVIRIGILFLGGTDLVRAGALRQGLREHGYLEGKDMRFEMRPAEGRADRLPALAAELVRLKVDVMVTESNAAAIAAKNATETIPVVMAVAGDPLAAGVVSNLARPGGNITGLTLQAPELSGKRLQLLKETFPKTGLVSIVYNVTNPASGDFLAQTKVAAQSLGLRLHVVEVRNPGDLDAAFQAVTNAGPSAFMTLADGMIFGNRGRIVEFAARSRLPGVFPEREFVESGGLMSYGPSVVANWHRAGALVARILNGAKPADMPIEQPAKFELVINLKAAKALGVTIPPSLLSRADEVIE
jgi:putative tryptophan/tyrosine transport system substrate-binding protein